MSSTIPLFLPVTRAIAAALLTFSAISSAQAALIWDPLTIVDHGSYITDTANKRDWYKFSNALTTVGWSMNDWLQTYGNNGWSVASEAQINGLKTQYGWAYDTLANSGDDSNSGLTRAMGDDLGFTLDWTGGLDNELGAKFIDAMSSLSGSVEENGVFVSYSNVSSLRSHSLDTGSGVYYYGDEVDSFARVQRMNEGKGDTGIWLSRASADVVIDVPEPGSAPLMLLGMGGLLALRRSRSWALKRQHVSRAT